MGMSLLERITVDPDVVHGRPVVRGTRIRVADVLSLLAAGADEAEILEDYPYVAAEDIRACLAYAAAQADHAAVHPSDGVRCAACARRGSVQPDVC